MPSDLDASIQRSSLTALRATLVALPLGWLVCAFIPSTWTWGLDTFRHLAPETVSALVLLAGLALLPVTARRAQPACEWIAGRAWLWAPAASTLALLLSDRVRFIAGGAAPRGAAFAALAALVLTLLAAGFVRALGLRGASAFAAMATAVLGGTLGLLADTRTALLCISVAAAGWACVALAGRHPSYRPLAIAVAALTAPLVALAGGGLGLAAFGALRLADVSNALVALAPMAAIALPLVAPSGPRRAPVAAVIGAFALPFAALSLAALPAGDVARHLDLLAPAAVALSFAAAWLVGDSMRRWQEARWLAAPVGGIALASTLAWLAVHHDPAGGRAWVEHFARQSAVRPADESAAAWEYLGRRAVMEDRWRDAALAWERVAALQPSARALTLTGIASEMSGDPSRARNLYRRSLAIDPDHALARRALERGGLTASDPGFARHAGLSTDGESVSD